MVNNLNTELDKKICSSNKFKPVVVPHKQEINELYDYSYCSYDYATISRDIFSKKDHGLKNTVTYYLGKIRLKIQLKQNPQLKPQLKPQNFSR